MPRFSSRIFSRYFPRFDFEFTKNSETKVNYKLRFMKFSAWHPGRENSNPGKFKFNVGKRRVRSLKSNTFGESTLLRRDDEKPIQPRFKPIALAS